MVPVMSLHDILTIFLMGVVAGVIFTAYTTHKVKQYFKKKFVS